MNNRILILDFGSQLTQLIARRIRELNVYCEIHPCNISDEQIKQFAPGGIILSGGPNSVNDAADLMAPESIFTLSIPVLGICYGMQTMANQLGGHVSNLGSSEFGYAQIYDHKSELFAGINNDQEASLEVWMSHADQVTKLPDGFSTIASSDSCPIAAMADSTRHLYGVQFHPEATHTKPGKAIIRNFVIEICKCSTDWNMPNYAKTAVSKIKQQVGQDQVILALSGGVDSSVAGVLIHQAIGNKLTCLFVDTGLLRLNEAEQVMAVYQQKFGLNVLKIDAQEEFFTALKNVVDPEQKRKIIGKLFVTIFQREAAKVPQADQIKWLAQGTIYPDIIESGMCSQTAHTIKSHHNVGGLPESLHLKLLEPLRELFKDEVRTLGETLGIEHNLLYRHPFPGPGLAIRILGAVTQKHVRILQQADAIFIEELRNHGYYNKVAQAFAVFLPIKSVGVMGDGRTYEYVIALRAVETSDFMSANVANLPLFFITLVANRISNEVKSINRVVYDVSSKPPATIEWE